MVKTIITPKQTLINLSIPEGYVGKQVEVLMYAVDELVEEHATENGMAGFWGIISDETASDLHTHVEKARNEWDRPI